MLSQGRAGLGKHKAAAGNKANGESPGVPLSHDAVKLLKTQDAGYLRTVAARGRKGIERLEQEVGIDTVTLGTSVGRHRRFSDEAARGKKRSADGELLLDRNLPGTVEDGVVQDSNAAGASALDLDDLDTPLPSGVMALEPKSKKASAAKHDAVARLRAERKKRKRLQEMRVAKLEALKKRQQEILAATDQLELQRAKMARTVGGVNRDGVKFKIRERKR
jgi:U3 small nucleolar RNA-associated protein 11